MSFARHGMKLVFSTCLLLTGMTAHGAPPACVSECNAGKTYAVTLAGSSLASGKNRIMVSTEGVWFDCADKTGETCDKIFYSKELKVWCWHLPSGRGGACNKITGDKVTVGSETTSMWTNSQLDPDKFTGRVVVNPEDLTTLIVEQGFGSGKQNKYTTDSQKMHLSITPLSEEGVVGYRVFAAGGAPGIHGNFVISRLVCPTTDPKAPKKPEIISMAETPVELGDGKSYAANGCKGPVAATK